LMDLEQDVNVSTVTFTPRWLAVWLKLIT
jgi:hypothetical protein